MSNELIESFIAALPAEKQDEFRLAQIETEEKAIAVRDKARSEGLPLAVKVDGQVFVNAKVVDSMVLLCTPKVITRTATPQDYVNLLTGLGDLTCGSRLFVEDEVDTPS